ncbi:hypothetical protein KGQ19_23570 [Catenulispora sp. NL8]|uniref:Sucraseferredoxin family protein n=1 Tax=Catenulispora pinistramenti TaxID=2705254 RepID=A0ABS5KUV4_9ACTN|nr:sucrase ferredoxin [Catenulispora pinistramenti]MBS2549848.1 hypothetical protein [Catenulispora pinistramenti]
MSVCDYALGGCAALCRAAREPLRDTAPPRAKAWLAVEHPGPWPAFGWPSDLPGSVVEVLTAAPAYDVRPQLIRRPDREGRVAAGDRVVFVAGGPLGARWLERRVTSDLGDLEKLDLAPLAEGGPPGFGSAARERVLLVCTHGKRDVCCARYGAPVARELAARGLPVWETTHLGGDQFAANMVCLPDGTYHGRLDRASAADVAFGCLRGEVSPAYYRGRAGISPT